MDRKFGKEPVAANKDSVFIFLSQIFLSKVFAGPRPCFAKPLEWEYVRRDGRFEDATALIVRTGSRLTVWPCRRLSKGSQRDKIRAVPNGCSYHSRK